MLKLIDFTLAISLCKQDNIYDIMEKYHFSKWPPKVDGYLFKDQPFTIFNQDW